MEIDARLTLSQGLGIVSMFAGTALATIGALSFLATLGTSFPVSAGLTVGGCALLGEGYGLFTGTRITTNEIDEENGKTAYSTWQERINTFVATPALMTGLALVGVGALSFISTFGLATPVSLGVLLTGVSLIALAAFAKILVWAAEKIYNKCASGYEVIGERSQESPRM
jgi:hypothetical protein